MKKIIVLGAGMVGKAIAADLSKKHEVTAADISEKALEGLSGLRNIRTRVLNVSEPGAVASAVAGYDLAVSAVPGFLGFRTLTALIDSRIDTVDISFLPEDVLQLDALAKKKGVTVITDCGVAPGMPNYIIGYHNELMKIEQVEFMVGGLPKIRTFPFEYKAPFSPCDVLEEYTRPARYVENGRTVVKPAMSDTELIDFENAGTLEAFNSDGLRSLIYTMKNIPDMKEKTLRYPGHIRLIQALKAAGFLGKDPVKVNGADVIPFDLCSELLFKAWKPAPDEPEFTVMRVSLKGTEKGQGKTVVYDLFDEFDPVEKFSSMARTTGFTATGTAEMILNGIFTEKGVFPPELTGKNPRCFHYILDYLKERNVIYRKTEMNS